MSPLSVDLAELYIEGGQRRARGHNTRLVSPPPESPDARKGILIILLDLGGPLTYRRRHLRHLLNLIQQTYYTTPGTILSALVYALRIAHRELQTINETLAQEDASHAYTCHAACLVLHEDELYIAQVGATTVAVLLPDGLKWFSPLLQEEEEPTPLGLPRDVRPHTARLSVSPDTMVLVLDSGWVGQIEEERFRTAISQPEVSHVLDTLAASVTTPEVSALALKVIQAQNVTPAPTPIITKVEEEPAVPPESTAPPTAAKRTLPGPSRLRRAWDGVKAWGARILPGREAATPRPLPSMPEPPPFTPPRQIPVRPRTGPVAGWKRRLWWIIVLLPIALILGLTVLSWQQEREREAQFLAALERARTAIAQAAATEDPQVTREFIRQAERALDDARQIRPDDPEIARLQQQIDDLRQTLERVQPLYIMWQLASFPGMNVTRVVVEGESIYLLDQNTDTVYRYTLTDTGEGVTQPEPERLFGRGDSVDGRRVGDLIDIAWLPAGPATQMSGLVALDGAGALFVYDPLRQTYTLDFARPETWRAPLRMLVYPPRLYVLDPGANTIFRFLPTPDGYTVPPDEYFTVPVDLTGVQDFAIDGNVYLLYPDGRLLRYFQGAQDDFTPEVVLSSPTAIYVTGQLPYLFIADAGNRRLLVLDKEQGNLVAQLVPGEGFDVDFGDLRALFVADDLSAVVFVAGETLWRAPLSLR